MTGKALITILVQGEPLHNIIIIIYTKYTIILDNKMNYYTKGAEQSSRCDGPETKVSFAYWLIDHDLPANASD